MKRKQKKKLNKQNIKGTQNHSNTTVEIGFFGSCAFELITISTQNDI